MGPRLEQPGPSQLLSWVQAVGFPAAFALVLLWALLWQLPQVTDRIVQAIERAAAVELEQLRRIQNDVGRLLDRPR